MQHSTDSVTYKITLKDYGRKKLYISAQSRPKALWALSRI